MASRPAVAAMKLIPLTQGKFAMVDDEDYPALSQFTWQAKKGGKTFYAGRKITVSFKTCRHVTMHRELLGIAGDVDHRDENGLNNQRYNLRPATRQQNGANRRKFVSSSSSKFKGVCWHIRRKKWTAQIRLNYKLKYLGIFESEIDAARAYDTAAREYFGSFGKFNFPL